MVTDKLNKQVTEFITTTVKRDNSARDEINKSKKDFILDTLYKFNSYFNSG